MFPVERILKLGLFVFIAVFSLNIFFLLYFIESKMLVTEYVLSPLVFK